MDDSAAGIRSVFAQLCMADKFARQIRTGTDISTQDVQQGSE
jgi:hypothetical protein